MKSDIGECVYILYYKLWGRTPIDGRLRSKRWWEAKLQDHINTPKLIKFGDGILWEGKPVQPIPIPYEVEYDLPNKVDCIDWFKENQLNGLTNH